MIESTIPEIGGVLSGQTSIKISAKKTTKPAIRKQAGGLKKRENTRQSFTRQKVCNDFLKNLE